MQLFKSWWILYSSLTLMNVPAWGWSMHCKAQTLSVEGNWLSRFPLSSLVYLNEPCGWDNSHGPTSIINQAGWWIAQLRADIYSPVRSGTLIKLLQADRPVRGLELEASMVAQKGRKEGWEEEEEEEGMRINIRWQAGEEQAWREKEREMGWNSDHGKDEGIR